MLARKLIVIVFPILCALVGGAIGMGAADVKSAACSAEVKN